MPAIKPASEMTVGEHTARYLTQHFRVVTAEPIVLEEEQPLELRPPRAGRYLAFDFQVPPHRELTFRVLVRGEVKITVNGEAALDFRQTHVPAKEPPEGWHLGWHEAVVWPDRFIDGWVRIGIEDPSVGSSDVAADAIWVCSGAPMEWVPRSTPLVEARRAGGDFAPDSALSASAWEEASALPLRKESLVERSLHSELRFLYDRSNLYVGFMAAGGPPGKAFEPAGDDLDRPADADREDIPGMKEVIRPDVMQEEFVSFILDAGADGRELVEFTVNASGEKDSGRSVRSGRDRLWDDESATGPNGPDADPGSYPGSGFWSFIDVGSDEWHASTDVRGDGWSACVTVPFALLGRYPLDGDVWHFNAVRRIYGGHRVEYFASPHPDMPHNPEMFAQVQFGPAPVVPVSADFGRRLPGPRRATVRVASRADRARRVAGSLELGGATVECRAPIVLGPDEEGELAFDLDLAERELTTVAIVLSDEDGEPVYRSAPIDLRLPRDEVGLAQLFKAGAATGLAITVAGPGGPVDWAATRPEEMTISLSSRRREHAAFQIGLMAGQSPVAGLKIGVSDLTGPQGTKVPAKAAQWFVEGKLHREPNPAYLLRREIPARRDRWVPDVLLPADAFAVSAGGREAVWVEVDVPPDARLSIYRGTVTVSAAGHQDRVISIELAVEGYPTASVTGVLDIGSAKQLLLDDYVVGDIEGAAIRFHRFEKHPDNPLIVSDAPTDLNQIGLYGTVLRDPATGRSRMWYISHSYSEGGASYNVSYAESDDGLEWRKPDLGVREFQGSRDNNLIDVGEEHFFPGPSVVYRPDDPDPGKRYVRYFQSPRVGGTCAAYSADGIHWDYVHTPLMRGSDAASASFDPRTGRHYFVTIEDRVIGSYIRRSPAFSVSEDGVRWSEFRPALLADARDDRNAFSSLTAGRDVLSYDYPDHFHAEFNDMRPYPYADLYLASVTVFECCGADVYKGTQGGRGSGKDDCVTSLLLLSSRDGDLSEWQRVGDRLPMIERGAPGAWDSGFITAADAPVVVGDELWMYYGGTDHSQQHRSNQFTTGPLFGKGDVQSGIGLSTLRLDGFVSVEAGPEPGSLTTRPLRFVGGRLEVNADVRGSLRVAVLDAEGRPFPGLSEVECIPLEGDSVRHTATWRDGDALGRLAGSPVRLAFNMVDVSLYAFQFAS